MTRSLCASMIIIVLGTLAPMLVRADTVTPEVRRVLDTPAQRARVEGLQRLGYSSQVAEHIVAMKGKYFVDGMLSPERTERYRPVTVYRGINCPAREYQPAYTGDDGKGASMRSGFLWASKDLGQALGFTEWPLKQGKRRPGLVLELQLPETERIFASGDAFKLSRLQHLPDDRIYLSRVGFPYVKRGTQEVDTARAPRWISALRAVKLGVVPRITVDDTSASFE